MATMQEASKNALLYSTAVSAALENASQQFMSLQLFAHASNLQAYASILEGAAAKLFDASLTRDYGVYFLPGTNVPSSFYSSGMDYYDYRTLMLGHRDVATSDNPLETLQRVEQLSDKVFHVAMEASIRAAKDRDSRMIQALTDRNGLLRGSALVSLYTQDTLACCLNELLFIPDRQEQQYSQSLADMEELGDSFMMRHMVTSFLLMRMGPESGLSAGQRVSFPPDQDGVLVGCSTAESAAYIEKIVDAWYRSVCQASGI